MIERINVRFAAAAMMAFLSCVVVFHLLVLSGVIPYHVVWGGRIEGESQMYVFEMASITINLAVICVVGMKGGYIKPYLPLSIVNFLLWGLVILFAVNTIGNLLAETFIETVLFTPLTLLSTVLCYRLVIPRQSA